MKKRDSQFQLNGGAEKELTESKSEKWAVNKYCYWNFRVPNVIWLQPPPKSNRLIIINIKTQRARSVVYLSKPILFHPILHIYFIYLYYIFKFIHTYNMREFQLRAHHILYFSYWNCLIFKYSVKDYFYKTSLESEIIWLLN